MVALIVGGCAAHTDRYLRLGRDHGLATMVLSGKGFRHRAFYAAADSASRAVLHVYLDGDGTPWLDGRRVASDPTPRDPMVLRLMLMDPNPSLYLGRPCYLGQDLGSRCAPRFWTSHRYGEEVVASMASAIDGFVQEYGHERIRLVGFSGGGTLALLLARRVPGVEAVITLAGNLDPDAWTRQHGYLPLIGSLNPGRLEPLPDHILQLHLVGSEDVNILPSVTGLNVETVPGIDHNCCWRDLWPTLLTRIDGLENR